MDAVSRLIHGAVDLHVHPSPSLFPRRIDEVEAARLADDAQMRAILVKSHHLRMRGHASELQTAILMHYTLPAAPELPLTPDRVWRAIEQAKRAVPA
jgi:hypothetical protein